MYDRCMKGIEIDAIEKPWILTASGLYHALIINPMFSNPRYRNRPSVKNRTAQLYPLTFLQNDVSIPWKKYIYHVPLIATNKNRFQ